MTVSSDTPVGGWVLGTAAADAFPTDNAGGASATATASILHNSTEVWIYGIMVHVAAAVTCTACDGAGTTIPGLVVDATAGGWKPFASGVRFKHATNANVGIKCGAGATATLFYRKVR